MYRKLCIKLLFCIISCIIMVPNMKVQSKESFKIKVKSATMESVTISWSGSTGSEYYVYRSNKKNSDYTKIASVKSNKFTDKNLYKNKNYYYKVSNSGIMSNTISKIKVKGYDNTGSIYGSSLTNKQRIQVGDKVANFVNTKTKSNMTEVEKVKVIHDYIVEKCEVAETWKNNGANTAWGALIYGKAQCSGYSRAFKALADASGLESYHVYADKKAINPSHQWNIVKVDKKYYHIDLNCNDNSGFYAVFLISDKALKDLLLMSWDTNKYPKCMETYDTADLIAAKNIFLK